METLPADEDTFATEDDVADTDFALFCGLITDFWVGDGDFFVEVAVGAATVFGDFFIAAFAEVFVVVVFLVVFGAKDCEPDAETGAVEDCCESDARGIVAYNDW